MSIAESFLSLHVPGRPLLMPNAWDVGSAKLLASLGFSALATTSSGYAATLGRRDGQVTRGEVIEHAAELVIALDVPVSADLEAGFGVEAVDRPVSVLLLPGGPTVSELAAAGAARISVGGAFAFAALGAVKRAAEELLGAGTTG